MDYLEQILEERLKSKSLSKSGTKNIINPSYKNTLENRVKIHSIF